MCNINEKCSEATGGLSINFNQDFTSLSVVGKSGYRIFTLSSVDRVEEIFCSNNEDTKIAERLFSSSLVAVVSASEDNKLKVCHFKKGSEICNFCYPKSILSVKLNRSRLVVCLRDSIYIHSIRDMRLLHSIRHISVNDSGLCSLSLSSHLAYPVSATSGELQIFDATNLLTKIKIHAHDSPLSAVCFSPNGMLIATASEKGTVIRVFAVKTGEKLHEFRRGVKRHVRIASLSFSHCSGYVCVSSNTETVHVFRIDMKAIEDHQNCVNNNGSDDDLSVNPKEQTRWSMSFITKAMTSYFPTHVSDVFTQDRAFATVQLSQPGLKYVCAIGKLDKETRLLVACEDGFLYIYEFNDAKGGECKLVRVHDLRTALEDVTELDMSGSDCVRSTMTASNRAVSPGSYAAVLKGKNKDKMSAESDKFRDLSDAVDYPPKSIFDEVQFPPVAGVQDD